MAKERIQKVLTQNGFFSRRKTEQLISEGRITVNGHKAIPGHAVDPAKDVIAVDGEILNISKKSVRRMYIMLNKPRGYVTTLSDELGRRCVTELISDIPQRLYPIGRLDRNSEGLLLMTNDGSFADLIMRPAFGISKTYRVTIHPDLTDEQAAQLSMGIRIDENTVTKPASVTVLSKEPGRVVAEIVIKEGKNRQIRRMCEALGLEVVRLKRTAVGPLKLGMLRPGAWRELTAGELTMLRNAAGSTSATQNRKD